jgi:L-seryl-tRNA(Ser) seleniumtransferase
MAENPLRQLPAVDSVVAALPGDAANSHPAAVDAARQALSEARAAVLGGAAVPAFDDLVARAAALQRERARPSLRPVINASGVVLQTNLGRAPLSERAIAAMESVARGYSNLEYDLAEGARGSRHEHVRELLRRTTGAEDGIVLNNNAAALFMVLSVFAHGREVIVSRGQAVEIGGGFRIPDVLRQSGAQLVEVGTTNRTYLRDYAAAITPGTAAMLRVHSSNFRVVGFTAETSASEMAGLARERGILLVDDLGSGCLVDTRRFGLAPEPTVQQSLAAGSDLALFSGDKLLGGPQCGIVVGRGELVERLRRHPLARALRVDKLTIAALNATLSSYAEGREADEIPIWRMLGADLAVIKQRASAWTRAWGTPAALARSRTMAGGGSLPGEGVETWCAALHAPSASHLAAELRRGEPAIVARIEADAVLLDPRTVLPADDRIVAKRLRELGGSVAG